MCPAFNSLSFRNKYKSTQHHFTKNNYQHDTTCQGVRVSAPTFGGIIRTKGPTPHYALVQGRYTKKWSFPKGHSYQHETALECCKREILEETGLTILPEPTAFLEVGFGRYFLFEVDEPTPLDPRDKHEIINTIWITTEEMKNLSVNADINQFLKSNCEETALIKYGT